MLGIFFKIIFIFNFIVANDPPKVKGGFSWSGEDHIQASKGNNTECWQNHRLILQLHVGDVLTTVSNFEND